MVNTSVVPSVVLALRTSFNSLPSFFMNSSTCGGREGETEGGRVLYTYQMQTHTHTHTHTHSQSVHNLQTYDIIDITASNYK